MIRKLHLGGIVSFFQNLRFKYYYRIKALLPSFLLWGTVFFLQCFVIFISLRTNVNIIDEMNQIKNIYYEQTPLPDTFYLSLPPIPLLPSNLSSIDNLHNENFDYTSIASYYLSIMFTFHLRSNSRLNKNTYAMISQPKLKDYIIQQVQSGCKGQTNLCEYYEKYGGFSSLPLDLMCSHTEDDEVYVMPNKETINNTDPDDLPITMIRVNVTNENSCYRVNKIKNIMYSSNDLLMLNIGVFDRCKNRGNLINEEICCTPAINKNGEYGISDIQFHQGKITSAVVVGWNLDGFIIRGTVLGHTLEYYLGTISATEDMYLCGNNKYFKSWISYNPSWTMFQPTSLRLVVHEEYQNLIEEYQLLTNTEYYIVGDGKKARVIDEEISLMKVSTGEVIKLERVWEELLEYIFEPFDNVYGNSPSEYCFYNLLPYEVYMSYFSKTVDDYNVVGFKQYTIDFMKNTTLPKECYSTFQYFKLYGAYKIKV
ncbi:Uncharacterized protein QTN25_001473 [Entamoeba marina]